MVITLDNVLGGQAYFEMHVQLLLYIEPLWYYRNFPLCGGYLLGIEPTF